MSKPRLTIEIPENILRGMMSDKAEPIRLMDMSELASFCGTTRQRLSYLYKRKKEGLLKNRSFPTPSYYYKSGNGKAEQHPLFTLKQAESYAEYLKLIEEQEKAYDENRKD